MSKKQNDNERLIKRFGLYGGFLFLALFSTNMVIIISKKHTLAGNYDQISLILIGILFLVTANFEIGKFVQPISLVVAIVFTFLSSPTNGYGIAQVFILTLLLRKYGFFEHRFIPKVIISIISLIGLIVFSLWRQGISFMNLIPLMLFSLIFFSSYFIIKFEEFKNYIDDEKDYKNVINILKKKISENEEVIKNVDTSYINPLEFGLSTAEEEILESLCINRESNILLAERLNKSVNTLKAQLNSIYSKIGIKNRHQLIEKCKNYYIFNKQ